MLYQIVWVREFGLSFGNTVESAALVTGVFMAGLGVGGWFGGIFADRRDRDDPRTGLRLYLTAEVIIAFLGLAIAFILPRLDSLAASTSSYQSLRPGWHVLTFGSYAFRYAIAVLLVGPITVLMGASLTFLMRCLIRTEMSSAGLNTGLLFGINTVGAALGCLLVDLVWIPRFGLWNAQVAAAALNISAALVAMKALRGTGDSVSVRGRVTARDGFVKPGEAGTGYDPSAVSIAGPIGALFLAGFAGMGFEILWFRFMTSALGQYRLVFSLLLFEILAGIGIGAAVGGALSRVSRRPRLLFFGAQLGIAISMLSSFYLFDLDRVQGTIRDALARTEGELGLITETGIHLGAIFLVVGIPSFLMGFAFPIANVIAQSHAGSVGRRGGQLYLGNTLGALCGSVATGFFLLPGLGMKWTAFTLVGVVLIAGAPLLANRRAPVHPVFRPRWAHLAVVAALVEWAAWTRTPADYLIQKGFRASALGSMRNWLVAKSEGLIETIVIADIPEFGRSLFTNGHMMSATGYGAQRYMRAFVHLPLLHLEAPDSVLVICFGVGNTAHAAALHRSVRRLEIVDISRHILEHAPYFSATNGRVLEDVRVSVFVNDGRHHLMLRPENSYDLVTLEPPPINFAGVGSLYSKEFYEQVRSRLKPSGFMSQWLPMRQVPVETAQAMIRAFVDVFPNALLLNGDAGDFLLVGRKAAAIEISPVTIAKRLEVEPQVAEDLSRYGLGTATEILGTFAGSGELLRAAVARTRPVCDDRPVMEYGLIYRKRTDLPPGIIDVSGIGAWCPACFEQGMPVPAAADLPAYLAFMAGRYARFSRGVGATGAPVAPLPWPVGADDLRRVSAKYDYLQKILATR